MRRWETEAVPFPRLDEWVDTRALSWFPREDGQRAPTHSGSDKTNPAPPAPPQGQPGTRGRENLELDLNKKSQTSWIL